MPTAAPRFFFTENETNAARIYERPNEKPYVKDAFHRHIINGETDAVNPDHIGTKAAYVYGKELAPGETRVYQLRMTHAALVKPFAKFDAILETRRMEGTSFRWFSRP